MGSATFADRNTRSENDGWTSARHTISVAQGRDALEELDPSEEGENDACHGNTAPTPCETVQIVVSGVEPKV